MLSLQTFFLERIVLTYDFRLPPGPRTAEYALLAEDLGFRAVWCPEVPAFGHDIWVTLARIAEKTSRIKFGPAVLIPSYRHPMAQASAIATLEQIAPGRLMVGFGTGIRKIPSWKEPPGDIPPLMLSMMSEKKRRDTDLDEEDDDAADVERAAEEAEENALALDEYNEPDDGADA